MFENLLFQQHLTSTLIREVKDGTLPQSLLFYGDSFSGKLTAALELARVLNCEYGGEWGCQCKSCTQNLSMQHPYVLLTGSRYFMQEINQSGDFLVNNRTKASQYIYIRSVRKLIKRFSEDLWDREDNKYKKCVTSLNKIEDVLYLLEPSQELPADKKTQSTIKKIATECGKLVNELPKGNIPINQIRKISNWVRLSTSGSKKIIILENAELMQDSSRNSLLKVLEEPPVDTYFILISGNKSSILPTILSRVRAYPFKQRDEKEQKLILEKIFKIQNSPKSIKEFFFSYSDYKDETFNIAVKDYLDGCISHNSTFSDTLNIKIDGEYFLRFLEVFTNELMALFRSGDQVLKLNQLEIINQYIKDKIIKFTHFNQNPMLLLETLFYEIKRHIYA
ncbi:MAG: hypothetical protein B6229_05470 [Spirochaetaceae bacterium 4572_7]|nr:MAG: hypothetical protein B6229_05470 [Spirochaetaceae bacterium 4572_7]